MRKVTIKRWIPLAFDDDKKRLPDTGKFEPDFSTEGVFHQWGSSYEDCGESGAPQYTTAIVELADGTVAEVLPTNIKFTEPTQS